jgi:hypothetical protein
MLMLAMPFEAMNQKAIEALERIDPALDPPWAIVGQVSYSGAELRLCPYSLLRTTGPPESRIQNLNLDDAGDGNTIPAGAVAHTFLHGSEDVDELPSEGSAAILNQWAGLEDELQRLAETGARSLSVSDREKLTKLAFDLRARSLFPMADCIEAIESSRPRASVLLRSKYICMLYNELASRVAIGVDGSEVGQDAGR